MTTEVEIVVPTGDVEVIAPAVEVEVIAPTGAAEIFVLVPEVGPPGAAGGASSNNILYDTVDPTTEGADGNFYINTTTHFIFGPKSSGSWPAGTSLIGPQGNDGADGQDGNDGTPGTNGTNGTNGRTVLNGVGAPDGGTGSDGDFYVRTSNYTIYGPKASGSWGSPTSLIGAAGADGSDGDDGTPGAAGTDGRTLLNGTAAPTTEGSDGDFYIRTSNWTVYGPKTAGAWGSPTSLVGPAGSDGAPGSNGSNGSDGKTVRNGSGAPSGGLGVDGDFYIDTAAWTIYGPKASGSWGSPASLIGAQGDAGAAGTNGYTILNGTAAPTTEGVNGDFYLRTSNWTIYGPKAGGAWGSATSLVGPTGPEGPATVSSASPSTPSVGTLALARVKRADVERLGVVNSFGRVRALQNSFAKARMCFMTCGLGALHGFGVNVATVTGTQTFPTPASTNIQTRARRASYASATTANAGAGWNDNTNHFFTASGCVATFVFGFSDPATVANSRSFIGFKTATTALGGSDPSSLADMFGFGHDSGDTALQFMHNDNTGTATKVALTGFNPQEVGELYEATIYVEFGGAVVHYQIIKLSDGTTYEGSVNTNLPANTTGLKPFMHRGNGSTTLAVGIEVVNYVFEGEYA